MLLIEEEEIRKLFDELKEIFGDKPTQKIYSHFLSINEKLNNLIKSRDNWKSKYLELKNDN